MPGTGTQPLIFGEVLFDEFADGSKVLGGAPFNVAWHLRGFGLQPLFCSAVGQDNNATVIQQAMQNWQMDRSAVQIDSQHPTGRVTVTLQNGQPSFDIVKDVAYDFIQWQPVQQLLASVKPALIYHGSLAARAPESAATLQQLRQTSVPRFVDINLRDPWWQAAMVKQLLQESDWVKLNDQELMILADNSNAKTTDDLINLAQHFQQQHHIANLIITLGAKGAFLLAGTKLYQNTPVMINDIQDTVGAGDAFSSVCIYGVLQQWDVATMLQRAAEFAARICQQHGATAEDKQLYQSFIKQWQS